MGVPGKGHGVGAGGWGGWGGVTSSRAALCCGRTGRGASWCGGGCHPM